MKLSDDEVGELPMATQARLLRVLETGEYIPVGATDVRKTDVRVVAATNVNIQRAISEGRFREDLYYRLSVFPISLPRLADRADDVLLLAQHFLTKMSVKYEKRVTQFSVPAMNMLQAYSWPGNVRELENCIERAVLTARDECVHSYNLPASLQTEEFAEDPYRGNTTLTLDEQLEAFERRVLEDALKRNDGNHSAVARPLSRPVTGASRAARRGRLGSGCRCAVPDGLALSPSRSGRPPAAHLRLSRFGI